LTRVTCAGSNWRYHTKRSAFELGTWLFVVYGSFHLQYFGSGAFMKLFGAEELCSVDDEINHVWRATWAVVSALQLGTIVGSVLVIGNHCLNVDDVSKKQTYKANVAQDTATPCATKSPCQVRSKAREEGLILYDGQWYSVGKFVPHHPGGAEILEQYLGTDISFVFRAMHRDPNKIMKRRKPVRAATLDEMKVLIERRSDICKDMMQEYQTKEKTSPAKGIIHQIHPDKFDLESFEKDATALWNQFVKLGYFEPSRFWIVKNTIVLYALLVSSIICMKVLPPSCFVVPGVLLGLFWHQSGYLMHDAEHHNVAGNERVNDILGWMYGTVCLGVNGAWWREEHREHHAFLNAYDSSGFKDPQVSVLHVFICRFRFCY
jgi:cytochrome b involved in lipid metabolism